MRGTMMDYPLTLTPILERAGKLFGRREIVSRLPDRSLHRTTYAEFYRRARALAEALVRAGLKRGDRVATLMWNHYAHLEAYFGVPAAGGVVHTLNLRLHPDELAYIITHAGDRLLILDDILLPLYEQLRSRVQLERVLVVPLGGQPLPAGCESYEEFLTQARGDFRYPALEENEAAVMCYTSGTTGRPKGVLFSHRALVLHTLMLPCPDGAGLSHHDAVLPVVPMFHANAWGTPFAATMLGSKQVFPGPHLTAEPLLDLLAGEGVTYTAGVPTVWLAVAEALEKNPGRWRLQPGLRMLVGGAAPPEALIRRYAALGIRMIHGWGMTEMSPVGSVALLKQHMRDWPEDEKFGVLAKQGLPTPYVEVRAVAGDAEVPWDGETMGELQVRGPWIAASYYNLPEEQSRWTADGWFRTGDVVTLDPEGYLKVCDRTKDLIKSGGEWISSVDLENALMAHPAVREAAVIGLPHPRWQERPLAVVVLKEGAQASPDELRSFLGSRFAKWQLPDAFVFTDQIPRTSVGKFMKTKLREQFKDWQWPAADQPEAAGAEAGPAPASSR